MPVRNRSHRNVVQIFVTRRCKRPFINRRQNKASSGIVRKNKFYEANRTPWLKYFWYSVFSTCIIVCMYQISLRVLEFADSPVNLDLKMEKRPTFIFPSLTFCSGVIHFLTKNTIKIQDCTIDSCSEWELTRKNSLKNTTFNTSKIWEKYTTDLRYFTVEEHCPIFSDKSTKCKPRPAREVMKHEKLSTIWGICLSLTLNKKERKFRGPFSWIAITYYHMRSMKTAHDFIFLHRDQQKLVHDAPYIAESIQHGYESTMRITAKEFRFLNTWANPCVSEDEMVKCHNDCVDRKMNEVLNCRLHFFNLSRLPECKTLDEFLISHRLIDYVYKNLNLDECQCVRSCDEVRYKMTLDRKKLGDTGTTKLILLFSSGTVEILYEKPAITVTSLISEIGGSMGLYLGISIFTLIELLHQTTRTCIQYLKRLL